MLTILLICQELDTFANIKPTSTSKEELELGGTYVFSKSPNGPILKFLLVTGEVMVLSELLSDLPVLLIFVGVASGP